MDMVSAHSESIFFHHHIRFFVFRQAESMIGVDVLD